MTVPKSNQKAVNKYATVAAPKTVKNTWLFYAGVLNAHDKPISGVKLPKIPKGNKQALTPEDVKKLLRSCRGSDVETAILLGLHGLRRSEIFGLKFGDIDLKAGVMFIHSTIVYDVDGKTRVEKQTAKTDSSSRAVPIMSARLKELLQGGKPENHVVTIATSLLYKHIVKEQQKAGVPAVGIHGLRHTMASVLNAAIPAGVNPEAIKAMGGWNSDTVLKNNYTHLFPESLRQSADIYGAILDDLQ